VASFTVPEETAQALNELARSHQTTVGTLLHGAWAQLLMWMTGQRDVAFGTVVSGRPAEVAGAESIVGLLVNTVPVRANITAATTTAQLLDQLQSAHNNTLDHQHLGLSDIQRITGHQQLFDTVFVYENYPKGTAGSWGEQQLTITDFRDFYHYPLTVQAGPGRELDLRVQFRTDVFDVAGIEALIERFQRVLLAMISDPTRPLVLTGLLEDGSGRRERFAQSATTTVGKPERHDNGDVHRAPETVVEQILADIYTQVLGVDRFGADESFFDLGGDSLSAMKVIAAINTAFDSRVSLRTLVEAPSVRALSQRLGSHAGSVDEVHDEGQAGDR
jgi:non-ribosomal peptide synthetase component F/acyl carrier protein